MNGFIYWSNGHITKVSPYFGESVNSFKKRILKAYENYIVRIALNINGEDFYIK
jgi:hypothetical protein